MNSRSSLSWIACPFVCALLLACGGGKPAESAESPAESPSPPAEKPAAEAPKSEAADTKADEKKPDETKPAEKADSGPTATRTPKDILTAPDVVFMLSFNDSDMKKGAEEKCEAQAKGDAKKNADCMAAARKKLDHDGFQFKIDKGGKWYWFTIKRNGNVLVNLHKVPIEFGTETKNSITIKTVGKDEGTKPGKLPSEVTFTVPNDYQIVVKDPKDGNMVYEAKIGIVAPEGSEPKR